MLLADMMIRPVNGSLHDGKEAFSRIYVNVTSHIFTSAMIDRTMPGELTANLLCHASFVRHDIRRAMDLSLNNRAKVLCGNCLNVVRTNLATPLDKGEHSFLSSPASSKMLALVAVFVLLQSSDERLVNFDRLAFAAELHGEM